jgi:hypothetical protein
MWRYASDIICTFHMKCNNYIIVTGMLNDIIMTYMISSCSMTVYDIRGYQFEGSRWRTWRGGGSEGWMEGERGARAGKPEAQGRICTQQSRA